MHADGSLGDCELHLASGRVALDRVEVLQANIAAGDVAIAHLAGAAHIDGARGQVRIGHASADLDLRSASGSFDIDRADGSVTATAASGAIRIGIAERTAAEIDVHSERGAVCNSVPAQEEPATTENRVAVHARTRYGDIVVQRVAT